MQLTIPTIVAATFFATLAFAPAIAGVFAREQSATVKIELPAQALTCAPAVKIVAALRGKDCK